MAEKISKAFLLAAGLGTRLRPLTDQVPKCLVPIHGKPLLTIWLEICASLEIREVLINTHYLAGQVRAWARIRNPAVRIHLFHEDALRGSAGTVAANRDFVRDAEDFYVFYADNLVSANLALLSATHFQHPGVLTLGLFHTSRSKDCGIVTLDASGCVTSFEEKPSQPKSQLANSGLFIARQELFNFLPSDGFADFGKDILPRLVGRMWGAVLEGYIWDVGTLDNYQRALEEWPEVCRDVRRGPVREKLTHAFGSPGRTSKL